MRSDVRYDVIVVGGGHAGCEAAHAAASMGCPTLLLTMSIDRIGAMSCNPAIGGVGKGHMVREIDALGGIMAKVADRTGIQFRRLNTGKGPAVRARRCQSDKWRYASAARQVVESTTNLVIKQATVEDLIVRDGVVCGVVTQLGIEFEARTVILTTGTFLSGVMHTGSLKSRGGRAGDKSACGLAETLGKLNLKTGRLKTGTVPRLDARSLDLESLEEQPGDSPPMGFSFYGPGPELQQVPCWLTETNPKTHEIIRANLHRSPMFSGQIEGTGPRYCPSIEDKIVRFEHKSTHRIFLEPEGLDSCEIYPNGISTSLPADVQVALVRSIAGCERAEITRFGYAIEYTFVDPTQLTRWLALPSLPGLYLAGQINGTTGYEEAAGQGIVAGINAALFAKAAALGHEHEPFVLDRSQAYIGVMIDDLVTRGCSEPYRMFTSRAEHRLLLREDNADERLMDFGRTLGLVDDETYGRFQQRWGAVEMLSTRLQQARLTPNVETNSILTSLGTVSISDPTSLFDLFKRPDLDPQALSAAYPQAFEGADADTVEQVWIRARYEGYIRRQEKQVERHLKLESMRLPDDLDYRTIKALSHEVRQALTKVQPGTIGQAGRVEGVTPAAIGVLLVHLKQRTAA
jgi:tRNA uridine 5-carboxymethylaminomethyl modification enzyme